MLLEENTTRSYTFLIYDRLEQYEEIIGDLTRHLELDPDNSHAFNNRGLAYIESGQTDKGLEDLERAILCDSLNPVPHRIKGYTFKWLGEYERSVESYTRVIEIEGDDSPGYISRGDVYLEMGLPGEAIRDYDIAIKFHPDNEHIRQAREEACKGLDP